MVSGARYCRSGVIVMLMVVIVALVISSALFISAQGLIAAHSPECAGEIFGDPVQDTAYEGHYEVWMAVASRWRDTDGDGVADRLVCKYEYAYDMRWYSPEPTPIIRE